MNEESQGNKAALDVTSSTIDSIAKQEKRHRRNQRLALIGFCKEYIWRSSTWPTNRGRAKNGGHLGKVVHFGNQKTLLFLLRYDTTGRGETLGVFSLFTSHPFSADGTRV
jgi:hypothetical protein